MWIEGLDHIQLAAPPGCESQARRFFGELLGLREIPKPSSLAARGGVWFSVGEQGLHIGVEDRFVAAQKAHPALRVDPAGLDALAERLTGAGVEFVIPPTVRFEGEVGEQATMFLLDPAGNALEFKAMADPGRLFAKY